MKKKEFKALIYAAYGKEGRSFPWRGDSGSGNSPYIEFFPDNAVLHTLGDAGAPASGSGAWGILVSEIMLQQTQTGRVVPYWKRWLEKWPSPAALNGASLEEVLKEWSGLGYNRRGRYLKECAGALVREYGGEIPGCPETLARLPGIGPYTAGAIACFAFNYPSVFIETNIRSVMLHFFFPGRAGIPDSALMPLIEETLDRDNPRAWYWALMDYGASLKKSMPNPNRRGAGYSRQSAFNGSFRQIRGSLVRALIARGPATAEELRACMDTPAGEADFYRALEALGRESVAAEEGGKYRIGGAS